MHSGGLQTTPTYIKVETLSAAQVIGRPAALIGSVAQAALVMTAVATIVIGANAVATNWMNWSF